jgi:glycopeptide antibiotics resistance protein
VLKSAEITSRDLKLSWRNVWLCMVFFIVFVTTFPLADFVGHAHWDRVIWIPFQDVLHSLRRSLDGLANIALYVPFGFSYVQSRVHVRKGGILEGALLAALLSVSYEFYQVFCHGRFPSMMDVTSNTVGGVIGALIAGKLHVSRVIIDK